MFLKRLIRFFTLIIMLAVARAAVLYLIEPVDYSIFFNRILVNKAKKNGGTIDLVFLGDSRTHRAFDPKIFEQEPEFGAVFNASSGLQPIRASYFMLKEITKRYHPKYVVVGLTTTLFNQDTTLPKLIVLDRLHGRTKWEFLKSGFKPEEYLNAVSLCYRFRNNLTAEKIAENISEKKEIKSNGYSENLNYPDLYTDSGFIYSYLSGNVENTEPAAYDTSKIDPEKLKYLKKIIDFCEREGIRLFFVTPPTAMVNMYTITNYQEVTDFFSRFAEERGIPYHNLNYLRDREKWLGDQLMFDAGHVNGKGAEAVSSKYAGILKAEIEGTKPQGLFLNDAEAIKADVNRILAVGANITITNLTATIHISSTQTVNIKPLYRILFSLDDENYIPLTEWSEETEHRLDMSAYRGTAHFLIEAMSPTGEPGATVKYHIPI